MAESFVFFSNLVKIKSRKAMSQNDEIYPVEVYDGDQWQASLVKSLLDNAEIESFLKDERMGVLAPWNVAGGGAGSVKIFVSNVDYEKAKEVVEQYEKAEGIEE
jgi:hypothetical protein